MSNLSNKLTLDASLHNLEMNKAASSVKLLDKQIANAEKSSRLLIAELKRLTTETKNLQIASKNAASSVRGLFDAFKSGNIRGVTSLISSLSGSLKTMSSSGSSAIKGAFSGLASSAMKCINPLTVCVTAVGAFGAAAANNIEIVRGFEESISRLSSITGATGQDLEFYKKAAIELGSTTTQSASQVAEAFAIIGSKTPELLKSKEALKEVTKDAITLSEAATMSVEEAATALTGVLNQFKLDANKSTDVINMLAAASKEGAGDINYLNSAIVNCGSVASSIGVSVNHTISIIEQLAQAGMDASSAGNNLKNIFLALETSADNNLRPSVVGIEQALDNLKKKGLSTVEMVKMFGKENIAAATIIMNSTDKIKEMNTAIQGTNTAELQAKTNTDNLNGSLKNLSSAWEGLNLTINSSSGALKDFIDLCTSAINAVTNLIRRYNELGLMSKEVSNGGATQYIPYKDSKGNTFIDVGSKLDNIKNRYKGSTRGAGRDAMYLQGIAELNQLEKEIDDALAMAKKVGGAWSADKKQAKSMIDALTHQKQQVSLARKEFKEYTEELKTNEEQLRALKRQAYEASQIPTITLSSGGSGKTGSGKTGSRKTTSPTTPEPEKTEYQKWEEYIQEAKDELEKLDNLLENGAWGDPKTEKALQAKSEKIQQVFKSLVSNLEKIDYKEAFKGNAEAMQDAIRLIESYSILADIEEDYVKGLKTKEEEAKKAAEEYLKLLKKTAEDVRDSKIALNLAFVSDNTKSTKPLDIVKKYDVTFDKAKFTKKVEDAVEGAIVKATPKVEVKPDVTGPTNLQELVEEVIDENTPKSVVKEPAVILGNVKVKAGLTDVYKQVEQILGTELKEINLPNDLITDLELTLGIHINTEGELFGDLPEKLKKNTEFLGDVQGVIQERMDAIKKEIERFKDFQANYEINLSKASTDEEKADIEATQEYLKGLIETYNKLKTAKEGVLTQTTTVEDESTKWKLFNDTASNLSSVFNQASSAVSQFGENSKAAVAVLGALLIAGIIASLMASYAQAMASPATSSGGIWTWIAGGIAGAAALASMITQLKAAKGYSTGGIVGGTSTMGDFNVARLNSGEMVINKSQLGHLWNLLNNTESLSGRGQSVTSGNVEFKIRGRNLIGVLSNENSRASRI